MTPRSGPAPMAGARPPADASLAWLCLAIVVAVVLAYAPAITAGFIWDDSGHVTRPDLQTLGGLSRIWFEIGATQQYYPVLHSAFWLEHVLWGDHALGYHLLNVLLHALSACLFAVLLRRLAVPGAALAALLFALHPVCVESVAWVAEQKNTLSTVLYLGAALTYLRFDQVRRWRSYALATVLFALAVLTKTVTATLPAALWVILWWKRDRLDWRRDVVPLLPWLGLGIGCGLYTAHFERVLIGAQGTDFALGGLDRCLLAGRVFWSYLGKLLWPANLIFIYPRWTIEAANVDHWLGLLAALALLGLAIFAARRKPWGRGVLVALLLFGGTLFPVLGFFNVYPFRYSYVADHFQYLASLAIFALAGAGLASVSGRRSRVAAGPDEAGAGVTAPGYIRFALPVATLALLALLGVLTFRQTRIYRDVLTLYETTLARNPAAWLAHNNLAIELANAGRVAEAIPHYEAAIRLKPDYALAENNLGDSLIRLGRVAEAIPHLERALQLEPRYAVAHRNLGMALAMSDRTAEAVAHFAEAVKLQPTYAEAELYWAVALAQTGHPADAVPHFERVLALDPSSADAHLGLADALRQLGRADEAQQHAEAARRLAR